MNAFQTRILRSVAELRAAASEWDDLWRRSSTHLPVAQAEPVALWVEQFAANEPFCAVTLSYGPRLVAALPLVAGRCAKVLRTGRLPANDWSPSGQLLIDETAATDRVADALVDALRREVRFPLLWLEGVNPADPAWNALLQALARQQIAHTWQPVWDVGLVDVSVGWKTYEASRSGNNRRKMRQAASRLEQAGGGALRVCQQLTEAEVEPLLRRGFEVEDRSWKSSEGSSVLRSPGIFDFYCRQARALAAGGNLELVFVEHAGQAIAFEYGWFGKGTYFSPKVGYDESFSQFSPGQLLRRWLYEEFCNDARHHTIDFSGPLVDATARWATGKLTLGRLLVALRGPIASWVVRLYPRVRAAYLKRRQRPSSGDRETLEIRPIKPSTAAPQETKPATPVAVVASELPPEMPAESNA